jgi:hypothetical protein
VQERCYVALFRFLPLRPNPTNSTHLSHVLPPVILGSYPWHPTPPYSINAYTSLTPPVYQKVVPAPVFALLIELTTLGPETEGAAARAPAPAAASLADIDDAEAEGSGSPAGAGGSASGLSGNEWERVSDEGVRA